MEEHGLSLAAVKTEIVMLTRRRISTIVPIRIDEDTIIETKRCLKYLSITLDTKLNYWEHISQRVKKAGTTTQTLSRLIANMNGPKASKRKLLMSVTHSILLYGAEIWAGALEKVIYAKGMISVQRRGALRVACAYRTVSEAAVLVIAGIIPIRLLAKERKLIYDRKNEGDVDRIKADVRRDVMLEWQEL